MKTLKELVIESKCRRGPADGTDKRGAFWNGSVTKIRRSGGDGIGQSSADVTHTLHLKHYRSGEVRAVVKIDRYHQNGSYSGGGTEWVGVSQILDCATVEEVITALINAGSEESGRLYSEYYEEELTQLLTGLGMVESLPAPDEANAV